LTRFLAEVVRKKVVKKGNRVQNFDCVILSLKVKIKGPARKTYKIPKGIVGKTFNIKRTYLKEWQIKKGELVVLNPEETSRCIKVFGKELNERRWKNFLKQDINNDGLYEFVYNNNFIKAVISPHYGARLLQLWNKGTGNNELFGGGFFRDKGYIELGGIEETLSSTGRPDELWNGNFKLEQCKRKNKLSFLHKVKNQKALSVRKRFLFFDDFPGLSERVSFSFKPRKGKGGEKRKYINLVQTIFFAIGGIPDYKNFFCFPQSEGLECIRFNRPLYRERWEEYATWDWTHQKFSLKIGLVILTREDSFENLLLFFPKGKINYIWAGNRSRTPRVQLFYKKDSVKAGKNSEYNILITTANKFSFGDKEVLCLSKGLTTNNYVPLSFVYYTEVKKEKQLIVVNESGNQQVKKMKKLNISGIRGSFFHFSTEVEKGTANIGARLKNKNLRVVTEIV